MDAIQRKLAFIDKQLAGRDFHKRIVRTSPLVFVAVGLIAGILIQEAIFGSRAEGDGAHVVWLWLMILGLGAGSAVVLFVAQATGRVTSYAPLLLGFCALVCFACLGAIRLMSFYQPEANDIRNFVGGEEQSATKGTETTEKRVAMDSLRSSPPGGGNDESSGDDDNSVISADAAPTNDGSMPATIRGVIVTKPYVDRNPDWKFARFKPTDPTSSFYLRLTEAKTVAGWAKVSGNVRVQVDGPVLDLKAGDCIQAYCRLDRFGPSTNPGQFDMARHLAGRNVFISASVKSREGIELIKTPPAAVFTKVRAKVREVAAEALLGSVPPEEPGRGLVEALLLGYRGDIDSDTYRAFRRTGLLHYVSLSGMHFGILIGIVWWVCKTAGLAKRSRAAVCTVAIAVFLLVVPAQAPTARSAIIAWVFCASVLLRRHANPFNTLSLAAIVLLLIQPTQLFAVDWQLSFACVLGILLFTESIRHRLDETADGLAGELDYRQFWRTARIVRKLAGMVVLPLSVGFGAWLGGAGIMLYCFYTITPLASIWTLLVLPLMGAILTLGFVKIILFFLLPTLSAALGVVVTGLSDVFIRAVKLFAALDFTGVMIGHVPVWLVVLYCAFVPFAFFVHFRRPSVKKAVCAVMAVMLAVFIGGMKWQRTHRGELILTCLDVSHGQAIMVEFPGGGNAMFDAGSLHKSDIGRRIVGPFLDYGGISSIDAVFVSHNDIDHVNGIPEVVEWCKVGRVYANGAFFEDAGQWGAAKFLGDFLSGAGLEIEPVTQGLDVGGRAHVKSVWPSAQLPGAEQLSDNDRSQVFLIEFAGRKILLCSDMEKFAQREIIRQNPDLRADIVVAPHHGSTNTADPDFLKAVEAKILIISCGQTEYQRQHKSYPEDTMQRLFTPADGAVTVCISEEGKIQIRTAARRN